MKLHLALLVSLVALAVPRSAFGQTCPDFNGSTDTTGYLEHPDLAESSGLAASHRHPGLFWTHNDSGGQPRLFVFEPEGTHVAEVHLQDLDAVDWEDMAVAPCRPAGERNDESDTPRSCVYVGDIGDNQARRDSVTLHRFPEPKIPDDRPATLKIDPADISTTEFTYEDGPRDAETLMVHPTTARIYVIGKDRSAGISGVYRLPTSNGDSGDSGDSEPPTAQRIADLDFSGRWYPGRLVTAGDIAPSGESFSVRTYDGVYTYCSGNDDFETAFANERSTTNPPPMLQSEALAYALDGDALWTTSERRPAPIVEMRRDGDVKENEAAAEPDDESGEDTTSEEPNDSAPPSSCPTGCSNPGKWPPSRWLIVLAWLAALGWGRLDDGPLRLG